MTDTEAQEIVRALDPDYAAEIDAAHLTDDVARLVWRGAAARLQEAHAATETNA